VNAPPPPHPSVSVIISCYREDRFELLLAAIDSVLAQTSPPHELIVVVDHNDDLEQRVRRARPRVAVVPSSEPPGPSGTRNVGVRVATGEVVAFIDDDATAEPDWLARLVEPYGDPAVVGVGGGAIPMWEGQEPAWFPAEFNWVIGCSWRGLPVVASTTRNLIGCNMSFRRFAYVEAGGLANAFFFRDRKVVNEETEFSIRLVNTFPRSKLMFLPDVVVRHFVPHERTSVRYFVKRCWREGQAKRITVKKAGASVGLSPEWTHVSRVIPSGIVEAIRAGFSGRPSALSRIPALLVGTVATAIAFSIPSKINGRERKSAPPHDDRMVQANREKQ
jgi:glycosyltransferase involved in cell wall biosynthesis